MRKRKSNGTGVNTLADLLVKELNHCPPPAGEGWQHSQDLADQVGMSVNGMKNHLAKYVEEGKAEVKQFFDPKTKQRKRYWRLV